VNTLEQSIEAGPAAGVFYDRNGSLLASLEWGPERWFALNVYPGVLPSILRDMGVIFSLDREFRPRLGLVAGKIGMGFGLSHRGPTRYNVQAARINR
jgi:hypothetical protein